MFSGIVIQTTNTRGNEVGKNKVLNEMVEPDVTHIAEPSHSAEGQIMGNFSPNFDKNELVKEVTPARGNDMVLMVRGQDRSSNKFSVLNMEDY